MMTLFSAEEHKLLQGMAAFPELYNLLIDYHNGVLMLKPKGKWRTATTDRLRQKVFVALHSISIQLAVLQQQNISVSMADTFFDLWLLQHGKFREMGRWLDLALVNIIKDYCKLFNCTEQDFPGQLLAKMNMLQQVNKPNKNLFPDTNCLVSGGNKYQDKELEWQLNRSGWLTKNFIIKKFYNNYTNEAVLFCKQGKIEHIAVLIRLLYEASLLEAEIGKGYMKMAARHIVCNGKPVSVSFLSKLSSDILSHPALYADLVAEVKAIVMKVKNAKGE